MSIMAKVPISALNVKRIGMMSNPCAEHGRKASWIRVKKWYRDHGFNHAADNLNDIGRFWRPEDLLVFIESNWEAQDRFPKKLKRRRRL